MGHHEPEPEQAEELNEELKEEHQEPQQEQPLYEPPFPATYETSASYEAFSPPIESPIESIEPNLESISSPDSYQPSETEAELASFESPQPEEAENVPYDFSQTLDATTEASFEVAQEASDSADFSDVTDFANADSASGPISYTLTIEGIDTARLASDLKEAMTDSRFGWDVDEIFNTKSRDTLILRSLSPAKASILVSRIKYLPFKISWRQDVLTGT